MTYWILTQKGTVVARSSVVSSTTDDMLDENLKHQKELFMAQCMHNYETDSSGLPTLQKPTMSIYVPK
jgi:hypothetical protein